MSSSIKRIGNSPRWSDIVLYQGVARWVEVADDTSDDERGQIQQVLRQIDQTLCEIGSSRQQMLQIIVHLSSLQSVDELNRQWDQWVPQGNAPVRACVQSGLGGNCLVEMVIEAAVVSGS